MKKILALLSVAVLFFVGMAELKSGPIPATGVFPTGSMSGPRLAHTATLLQDGKVLIVGGKTSTSGTFSNTAELYDAATGGFSATGSLSKYRAFHTATLLNDGRVLIAGGWSNGTLSNTAEIYNPISKTFSVLPNMTSKHLGHTATLLSTGKVLITGGTATGNGGSPMTTSELFNPTSNSFAPTGSLQVARAFHSATPLLDGRVLILGGAAAPYLAVHYGLMAASGAGWHVVGGVGIKSAEIYSPTTGTFASVAAQMASGRYNQTATRLPNGKVLVAGGIVSAGTVATSQTWTATTTMETFDPATKTFSAAGSLSTGFVGGIDAHTASPLLTGEVLLYGGRSGSVGGFNLSAYFLSANILNPPSAPITIPADARTYHTATELSNCSVLITGGSVPGSTTPVLSSAKLYKYTCPPPPPAPY